MFLPKLKKYSVTIDKYSMFYKYFQNDEYDDVIIRSIMAEHKHLPSSDNVNVVGYTVSKRIPLSVFGTKDSSFEYVVNIFTK